MSHLRNFSGESALNFLLYYYEKDCLVFTIPPRLRHESVRLSAQYVFKPHHFWAVLYKNQCLLTCIHLPIEIYFVFDISKFVTEVSCLGTLGFKYLGGQSTR